MGLGEWLLDFYFNGTAAVTVWDRQTDRGGLTRDQLMQERGVTR